ncbi:MAG: OmpA family protein [Paludibacteraceae bacterium]|nr:OmpA family protein [Paludibacteraceae bacterium]
MKHIFKRICYTLVILVSLNFMMDATLTSVLHAAPAQTAQQRAKEKAKAQKAKEKAKAQKAKDKAKAQKAKEQAAAKKAKDKQRAADQRGREKEAVARVKQSQATEAKKLQAEEAKKQQRLAQEQAYEKRVADITKYNQKAAAYNARDISHRLGFWGQVGYSAIFPANFAYNASSTIGSGFNATALGGIGGGAGVGYQLRYKRFLFTTGAEFQIYTSKTSLYGDDKKNPEILRTYTPYDGYNTMSLNYHFSPMNDMWQAAYVQLPLLFGMEFAENTAYFLVGPKVGLNVIGNSTVTSTCAVRVSDKEFIDDIIHAHYRGIEQDVNYASSKQKLNFGLNVAAAAEVGICLDRWMQPIPEKGKKLTPAQKTLKKMHTRLALFAEYGVLNIRPQINDLASATDMPVTMLSEPNPVQQQKADVVSSLQTSSAVAAKLNPFMTGVKLTFMFDLPRENKKPLPMPKAPLPRMAIQVVNAETGNAVEGANVEAHWLKGKLYNKTTNSKGFTRSTYPKGEYSIWANKLGFYPSDTVSYTLERDLKDTVIIALRPEPVPVVYTLCGHVHSIDQNQPLEAEIRISSVSDTTTLYDGYASDNGLFVSNLLEGDYIIHARHNGFMPLDDTIHFTQDTLNFHMTRIKEGIRVRIDNLFFATNKTKILPQSQPSLDNLYNFLSENPTVLIMISGHTDNVGSERNNQILSEGRANSVRRELIKMGIDAERIDAEGLGESEPIDTNDTEEGRQNNRRVEFTILSTGGADIKQIE